jgi:hypothetical protein
LAKYPSPVEGVLNHPNGVVVMVQTPLNQRRGGWGGPTTLSLSKGVVSHPIINLKFRRWSTTPKQFMGVADDPFKGEAGGQLTPTTLSKSEGVVEYFL